jgi:ornithine cyclodeaminase/alanine dehydrogenase-like protein (mu-crystallin family)
MKEAVALMRAAFEEMRTGEALNHPRRRISLPAGSTLHYMAAGDGRYFGAKVYSTHPRHGANFWFLLFRTADAKPLAVFEANALGQIRTGAASGYATDLLARPGARAVAIIGSGFQARTQLEAMLVVRPIESVRVWSRSAERRAAFARDCEEAFGVEVRATATPEEAVRGAPILITATNAKDPVVEDGWVGPGTHINAMGSNQASRRELPASLVRRSNPIAVDSLETARMESGDLLLGLDASDWGRVIELKDAAPRTESESVSLFKSHGLAIEDVVAAGFVYERYRGSEPAILASA